MSFCFRPIGSTSAIRDEAKNHDTAVILDENDLLGIYPHLPAIILNAQIAQFAYKELGLWIVEGDAAVELVTNLKGSDNDPSKCAPNTWRFKIGSMLGVRRMNLYDEYGKVWITIFDNFIHAPKRGEIDRDMGVLKKFIH